MKVAYHFTCDNIDGPYDHHFYKIIFTEYLKFRNPCISSKLLIGDLLIGNYIKKGTPVDTLLEELIQVESDTWKRILPNKISCLIQENIFIVCFETIQKQMADQIHSILLDNQNYVGAFEIDNSNPLQWVLYSECITPHFRLIDKDFYVFAESDTVEYLENANSEKQFFKTLHFESVKIEFSNYRYSMLDDNHNFENGKRAVEWRKSIESLFSTITDEIHGKLIDTAPELSDKLWAITNAFDNAQIGEQYAQAMTSCRRVFEYVTDCIFPASNEIVDGHSLKKDKYKNRLLEFANRELKSNSSIDLIVASTSSLFDEWEKLYDLSNKGVHSETHRKECRRCIIRTILLLDDIVSLRNTPFDVNVKGEKFFRKFLESK